MRSEVINNVIAFIKKNYPERKPKSMVDMKNYYVVYAPLDDDTDTPQDLIGIDIATGRTWDFVPTDLQDPMEYFKAKEIIF